MLIDVARKYLGQEEKPNNSGFLDSMFEHKMQFIGWKVGWSWCMGFVRLVYCETYPLIMTELRKCITFGCLQTLNKCQKSDLFEVVQIPEVGGIIIWSTGAGKGHTGIVSQIIDDKTIMTIEGNTNKRGERDGKFVMEKVREYDNIKNFAYKGCIVLK